MRQFSKWAAPRSPSSTCTRQGAVYRALAIPDPLTGRTAATPQWKTSTGPRPGRFRSRCSPRSPPIRCSHGEGRLLEQLTKHVLESVLDGEVSDHLGDDEHDTSGKNSGNSRKGTRSAVLTDVGPVEVKVPRNTADTFEPQIVRKRQRRLSGVDELAVVVGEGADPQGGLRAPGRGVGRGRVPGSPSPR